MGRRLDRPHGQDGGSIASAEAILRHGGKAQSQRDAYAALSQNQVDDLIQCMNSLVLFPPDDTASTLDPGDPAKPGSPQAGRGSSKLTVWFNDPTDPQ
jgi:hypothetical protein